MNLNDAGPSFKGSTTFVGEQKVPLRGVPPVFRPVSHDILPPGDVDTLENPPLIREGGPRPKTTTMSRNISSPPKLRLRVTAAAETQLRSGHPWLFGNSLRESNRDGVCGDLAIVYDRKDAFLAIGLFDPDSPIRCRILARGRPIPIDGTFWRQRAAQSRDRRAGLLDTSTTGHRWIHGESDGWPGLVLDRYGATAVLKLYTAAWLPHLPVVLPALQEVFEPRSLVLRTSRNIAQACRKAGYADASILTGEPISGPVIFEEHGLRFESDVLQGQKTGFFLDQRDNRRWLGSISKGRRVLNAFSFSGGFSLHAAAGGAKEVTDLDISQHALEAARRNFALNSGVAGVASCRHLQVQADVFEWLERTGEPCDIVILDPPSLARKETDREGAIQAYARLSRLGARRVAPGGLLFSASCSAHVSEAEFFDSVQRGLRETPGDWKELRRAGHPHDHPASFPEAAYLKAIAFQRD